MAAVASLAPIDRFHRALCACAVVADNLGKVVVPKHRSAQCCTRRETTTLSRLRRAIKATAREHAVFEISVVLGKYSGWMVYPFKFLISTFTSLPPYLNPTQNVLSFLRGTLRHPCRKQIVMMIITLYILTENMRNKRIQSQWSCSLKVRINTRRQNRRGRQDACLFFLFLHFFFIMTILPDNPIPTCVLVRIYFSFNFLLLLFSWRV